MLRWLPFPSEREEYQREPVTATRRDGTTCHLARTLPGLRPRQLQIDEDQGVTWRRWPP